MQAEHVGDAEEARRLNAAPADYLQTRDRPAVRLMQGARPEIIQVSGVTPQ